MALTVVLLVWAVLMTASAGQAYEYHKADCRDGTPGTVPPTQTPGPLEADALLGNWTVVKHDKEIEDLDCLTVNFEMVNNNSNIQATFSTFDISSQQPSSRIFNGSLDMNNTVFALADAEDKYYLNTLDLENLYAIIFTCNENKSVRYVATKNEIHSVAVEGDDLKDVTCSGYSVSAQQFLVAMTLTAFALRLLV